MSTVAETRAKTRRQQQDYTRFDSFLMFLDGGRLDTSEPLRCYIPVWVYPCRPFVGPTSEYRCRSPCHPASAACRPPTHTYTWHTHTHTRVVASALCRPAVINQTVFFNSFQRLQPCARAAIRCCLSFASWTHLSGIDCIHWSGGVS